MNHQKTIKTTLCLALIVAFATGLCITPAFAQTGWALSALPDKTSYPQGATVTISGAVTNAGVPAAGVLVSVQVTDSAGNLVYSTIVTSAATTGAYSAQFKLSPTGITGTYSIGATAASNGVQVATAAATFTVTSSVTLKVTPNYASPGSTVAVTGTNYTAGAVKVALNWGGITVSLANLTATSSGALSGSFVVPSIASDVYAITATDSAGLTGSALFGVGQTDAAALTSAVNNAISNLQGNLTSTISQLNTAVSNLPSTVQSAVSSSLTSLTTSVNNLQGTVTALGTTLNNLSANSTLQGDTLALIYTNLNTAQNSLNGIPSLINGLNGNVSSVSSSVSSIQGVVSSLSGSVSNLQASLTTLQSDVTAVKDQTSGLSTTVGNQVASVSTLVIVAIVLALIAAIAAIASIVMMRRKIAG